MKRMAVLFLAVLLVVGLMASIGYSQGAKKVNLLQWAPQAGEENAGGWAVINYTPKGKTDATVQIKVSGLLPEHDYVYKTYGIIYCTFNTNKLGKGTCHVNFEDESVIDPSWEINIRDAGDNHLVLYYN